MEMNTLGIQEVELIARRNSCKIVAVREDERAGKGFTSNLFFLTKVGLNKLAHATPAIAPR